MALHSPTASSARRWLCIALVAGVALSAWIRFASPSDDDASPMVVTPASRAARVSVVASTAADDHPDGMPKGSGAHEPATPDTPAPHAPPDLTIALEPVDDLSSSDSVESLEVFSSVARQAREGRVFMLRDLCLGAQADRDQCEKSALLCELNLLYLDLCHLPGLKPNRPVGSKRRPVESLRACISRIGVKPLSKVLTPRCLDSAFWKQVATTLPAGDPREIPMRHDAVFSSQTFWAEDAEIPKGYKIQKAQEHGPVRMIPANERQAATFGEPRRCSSGCRQYPFGFAVPRANVVERVSRDKVFGFLPYVPGHFPGDVGRYKVFNYQDEWLSRELHDLSYFAMTHRRGGFDCMRHFEILSSGAVPFFADINLLPRNTMTTLPRDLIKRAMQLPGVNYLGMSRNQNEKLDNGYFFRSGVHIQFRNPAPVKFDDFNETAYFELADAILEHTKAHMTTAAAVTHMLRVVGYEEPKHVLVLARNEYDYIHQTVVHGLSDLGIRTSVYGHDFGWMTKRKLHSINDTTEASMASFREEVIRKTHGHKSIAGLAWVFGFHLDPRVVTMHSHTNGLSERIKAGEFDLVIYTFSERNGGCGHNKQHWGEVTSHFPVDRRVFVMHDDDWGDPDAGSADCCRQGFLFKREMKDVSC